MSRSSSSPCRFSKRRPLVLSSSVNVPSAAASTRKRSLSIAVPASSGRGGCDRAGVNSTVRAAKPSSSTIAGSVPGTSIRPRRRAGSTLITVTRVRGTRARLRVERSILEERQGPLERCVAHHHVAMHLVARASADRVVRLAAQQLGPGEPEVRARERATVLQRAERGERLDREQPLLGMLVGLLEIEARRVDPAQNVLHAAAEQLPGPHRGVRAGGCLHVLGVAGDREARAREPLLELDAQLRQLGLHRQVIGAVAEQHLVHPGALQGRAEALGDPPDAVLGIVDAPDVGEVVVVRELLAREHAAPVRRRPAEHEPDLVELVAHPAREDEALDPEAGQDLRQLQRMPEAVGHVARRRTARRRSVGTLPDRSAGCARATPPRRGIRQAACSSARPRSGRRSSASAGGPRSAAGSPGSPRARSPDRRG